MGGVYYAVPLTASHPGEDVMEEGDLPLPPALSQHRESLEGGGEFWLKRWMRRKRKSSLPKGSRAT